MSTKTTSDSSLQATKDMLDELDALMEKMLAIPVAEGDEAPPPNEGKAPTLTPTISATLTMIEPLASTPVGASAPTAEPVPLHPVTNPPHFAPPIDATKVAELPPPATTADAPTPQPVPLTNDVVPASDGPVIDSLLADVADPESALTIEWVYWPLLSLNEGFDYVTTFFGGAGEGLRTATGRSLLGIVGLALSAAATVWLLRDLMGWN